MPFKYPCTECERPSRSNQMSICCDICQMWTHFKCTNLTIHEFDNLGNTDQLYFCQKFTNSIFPFQTISNDRLSEELSANKTDHCCLSLPDVRMLDSKNCYLNAQEFNQKYSNNNDFCIIHINIRSLNKNFEKPEELLLDIGKTPEIIAISKTKLQTKFNTYLPGYSFIQNDSETNAGGVGLFIKDTLNFTAH